MTERVAGLAALASIGLAIVHEGSANALPLYTARSGRGCDNCHTDPTGWENPALSARKCNLSCVECHVDPSGGGLRNASGEFYGQATLPMFLPSHRGYEDWNRQPLWVDRDESRSNKVPDFAWGKPGGEPTSTTYDQARYAGLNADPLVSAGLDVRIAAWLSGEGEGSFFPMQFDTHAALHPVHRLTVAYTGGVIAESDGFNATFERNTLYAPKDVYVMAHELPYMTHVRAGRFVPPFGTRTEDHTSPIRRQFELDSTQLNSRVVGVEVGFAPNYPYATLAVFRPGHKDLTLTEPAADDSPPLLGTSGLGAAASAGYRELGWQLGGSAMVRRRDLADGGNTDSLSAQVGLNPWYWVRAVPLTAMAELAVGQRQREISGELAGHVAGMVEADLLVFNGFNVRAKVDWFDPDTLVADDEEQRVGIGADLHALPNTTLTGQVRVNPAGGDEGGAADIIVFTHLWL